MVSVKNLDYLRTLPEFGAKLAEALESLQSAHNTVEQQTNTSSSGDPIPPPAVNALKVTGQNGHFQVAITDNNPIYRDVHYWVEHADNPHFTNPHVVHMGMSRNHNLFLGNVTRYFRAYSSYGSSRPSAAVYHGDLGQPAAVSGGGSVGGPEFLAGQSSGTGVPGQGISGPGPVPFRAVAGGPPTR